MTHFSPPYVIVDPAKCMGFTDDEGNNMARRCPAKAFGDENGKNRGITYDLFNDDVLPMLKKMCRFAAPPRLGEKGHGSGPKGECRGTETM